MGGATWQVEVPKVLPVLAPLQPGFILLPWANCTLIQEQLLAPRSHVLVPGPPLRPHLTSAAGGGGTRPVHPAQDSGQVVWGHQSSALPELAVK